MFELFEEVGVVGGAGWLLAAATAAKLPTEWFSNELGELLLGVECATPGTVLLGVTMTGLMGGMPVELTREFC